MKIHFPIISIAIFLFSCSKNNEFLNENFIGEFPPPIELEGIKIFENEFAFTLIAKIDSLFIIGTQHEPLIRIYDDEQNMVGSFGRIGHGPGEFMNIPVIRDGLVEDSTIRIFAYDDPTRRWLDISLDYISDTLEINVNKEHILPTELSGTMEIFYLNNGNFIGVYDDNFFKILDERRGGFNYSFHSGDFKIFPLFNIKIDPYEVTAATNVNARASAISPDRTKFASVMWYFPLIEIFKTDSALSTKYILDSSLPSNTIDLMSFYEEDIIFFYSYINATNEYIYLLYSGEVAANKSQHETRIQVIDWDGHPINQYLIPSEYDLFLFTVDEKNNQFYGLSYNNDSIYKFNF